MFDVKFSTTCGRGAIDFDLMIYYGLSPHMGINIQSSSIVESLSDRRSVKKGKKGEKKVMVLWLCVE